jgi:4-amino-4-deoxy-L-arabinose transferase-like glycosyltransferase
MAIAGLPALFLIGWIACWVFLHRAPLWGFGVASAMSAASIVLAWGIASTGSASGGEQRNILFQSLFFNGITGLLWVGVLAIATAIVELVRMVLRAGATRPASETEPTPAPHQT